MSEALEEHFEWLNRTVSDIDDLKRPRGRYSFTDPYAERLRYTFRGAILDTLGDGEGLGNFYNSWRDLCYPPTNEESGIAAFYKLINYLHLAKGDDFENAMEYILGSINGWGPEHDKNRIFPRYYVQKIIKGEEVPLWVFQLSKNLDVSYLDLSEKHRFLSNLSSCEDLGARLGNITHFNIGLFDYEDPDRLNFYDENDEPFKDPKSDTNYIDCFVRVLNNLSAVRHLDLSGVIISEYLDETIEAIPNRENLVSLNISHCELGGYREIWRMNDLGLTSLEELTIRGFTDGLDFPEDSTGFLKNLRSLDISGGHVASGANLFSFLQSLESIRELRMSGVKIHGNFSLDLDISNLRLWDMTGVVMKPTPGEIRLGALSDLRIQNVEGLSSSQKWFLPVLTHLKCTLSDVGMALVKNYGFRLTSLDLNGLTVGDKQYLMKYLVSLSDRLRYLNIDNCIFGEDKFNIWDDCVRMFPNLEAFGFYSGLPDQLFEQRDGIGTVIASGNHQFKELNLRGEIGTASLDGVSELVKYDLEYLGVNFDEEVRKDRSALTNLNIPSTLKVFRCAYPDPIFRQEGGGVVFMHMDGNVFVHKGFFKGIEEEGLSLLGFQMEGVINTQNHRLGITRNDLRGLNYGAIRIIGTDQNEKTIRYY